VIKHRFILRDDDFKIFAAIRGLGEASGTTTRVVALHTSPTS
jgi:hypothetical protein